VRSGAGARPRGFAPAHRRRKRAHSAKAVAISGPTPQYEKYGYFEVMGGESGKHYRIRPTRQMNVDELDQHGARTAAWCFGPEGELPIGDVILAQKIALENDEMAALALANRGSIPQSPPRFG
jgi:hypothetical protein